MTEQTQKNPPQGGGRKPSSTDAILDLLLDALAERQKARAVGREAPSAPAAPAPLALPSVPADQAPQPTAPETEMPPPRPEPAAAEKRRAATPSASATRLPPAVAKPEAGPGEEGWQPSAALPSIQMGKLLGRLAILLALLVVVINIPIMSHGVSLARILPDTASLVIRDGLVLKGSGPNIYMLQDNKLRWISSMEAFEHLRLTWKDVHVVDDDFLSDFEMGHPIHLLLKCGTSPHIYAYENGVKRWIKDIDTFTAEGYVWDDVQIVNCGYLRGLPDGPPVPEDAGPPPQP